jgi:hypothetical protein
VRTRRVLRPPPPSRARAEAEVEAARKRETGALDLGADGAGGRDAGRALSGVPPGLGPRGPGRGRAGPPPHRGDPVSSSLPARVRAPARHGFPDASGSHRPPRRGAPGIPGRPRTQARQGHDARPVGQAAIKLAPAGASLVVCEGVETGIALAVQGERPVWAMGSAGAIERLAPVAGVVGSSCGPITTRPASVSARQRKPSRPGPRRASKPRPPARQPWAGITRISTHEDCRNERRRRPPDRSRCPADAGGADRGRAICAGLRRRARRGHALRARLRGMAGLGRTGWDLAAR